MPIESIVDTAIRDMLSGCMPIKRAPSVTLNFLIKPEIKKVIFHNPATIILWADGKKTVVKCQPGDSFDKEKGFLAAYMKRTLGNDNTFNKIMKRWVDDE